MNLKIHGDLSYFWQWDLDRKLIVEDAGVCSQVHFYNGFGEALVCLIRNEDGFRVVDVPNILLQKSEPIQAYLYAVAKDGTRTRSSHCFSVIGRSRPTEYVYTETEVFNYAYLDKRLKELEGEGLANAVADYLEKNPVQAGATTEEAAQIAKNKTDIEQLSTGKLDASKLPEAVNDALAQAKASGRFDGADGQPGEPGKDYILTEADKREIAELTSPLVNAELSDIVRYYSDLSTAITDINNGVATNALADSDNAKVSVFTAYTGVLTVMLLDDVSESVQIDILVDMDIALNGKTLTFTTPVSHLSFAENTHCRIFGNVTGSTVNKECDCSAYGSSIRLLYTKSDRLEVIGGSYIMNVSATKGFSNFNIAIGANEVLLDGVNIEVQNTNTTSTKVVNGVQNDAKKLEVRNCTISSRNGIARAVASYVDFAVIDSTLRAVSSAADVRCIALMEGASVTAENTTIFADAPGCHADDVAAAVGITSDGDSESVVVLKDCVVFGTHSAITSAGKLYINGGVYTGFCHGGVYSSGNTTAINDATLRCGNYEGEFDYSGKTAEIYGSMYIGGSAGRDNITAYLDGCTIEHNGGHPIVMRGTDGEQNNTINISNSTIGGGTIRIDNDTLKLNVGIGTNITTDMIDNPAGAEFTGELYRRNYEDKVLNGKDYEALLGYLGGIENGTY